MAAIERCFNVEDFRRLARRRLPKPMFHYIDGGSDDESTMKNNITAFDDLVLPRVVDAVGGTLEVILDGGVRRGTHVVKALAQGATACMIGRPYLYAVAAGGRDSVARLISLLNAEIVRAMKLIGARRVSDITRDAFLDGIAVTASLDAGAGKSAARRADAF